MNRSTKAVLFLTYRRFETAERVFNAIRDAHPPRLYFASNAPNPQCLSDPADVERVRSLVARIDWECEVHRLFRTDYLPVKQSVSSSIDWFFNHEEEGIILEDDILPLPSFFHYCDELLDRYRDNELVAMISGCNLISKRFIPKESYFFSRNFHIWGWASWRRAWKHYDVTMKSWPEWRNQGGLSELFDGNYVIENYWTNIFNDVNDGKINTWDFQWNYACWRLEALSILPAHNLTQNIGFGLDATNTTGETPAYIIESVPRELEFPLSHPDSIVQEKVADELIYRNVYNLNARNMVRGWIRRLPIIGPILVKTKAMLGNA